MIPAFLTSLHRHHSCHELSGLTDNKAVQYLSSSASFASGHSRECSSFDNRRGLAERYHHVWESGLTVSTTIPN